ncbi:unnamed protein product [Lampetra planeri]
MANQVTPGSRVMGQCVHQRCDVATFTLDTCYTGQRDTAAVRVCAFIYLFKQPSVSLVDAAAAPRSRPGAREDVTGLSSASLRGLLRAPCVWAPSQAL